MCPLRRPTGAGLLAPVPEFRAIQEPQGLDRVARVDAGLARARASLAEARGGHDAQFAGRRPTEHRAARVALAAIHAALGEAGADNRRPVEVAVRARAKLIGGDRD